MSRHSSIELLPKEIQADVHAAICEGATIDQIVARIRAQDGTCSRSAVGRFVKQARGLLGRRGNERLLARLLLSKLGDSSESGTGQLTIETLRSLALRAAMDLDENEDPPDIDKIGALALVTSRIESADKSGADRESAGRKGTDAPTTKPQQKGLSPEAVAHIRAAVEGYWGPGTTGEEEEAALRAYWEKRAQDAHED